MSTPIFFQGCSALCQSGIYSPAKGHSPWKQGQNGPRDVERSQVFGKKFPGFGKLQIADRLAFSAAALLFENIKIEDREEVGICVGSAFGSLSTDMRYMESVVAGFPRPAYFSATLPSSPVAEVAIQFGLKGPNRVIVGGLCPGLCALDSAVSILEHKKAKAMLVLLIRALEPEELDSVLVAPEANTLTYSYACLLSTDELEGALNYIATFGPGFCNDDDTEETEETYFYAMTQAAVSRCACRCDQHVKGFCGNLIIEKSL